MMSKQWLRVSLTAALVSATAAEAVAGGMYLPTRGVL